MKPRNRPPAGPRPDLTRVLLAIVAHAGSATEDQIVSYLRNVPTATVARRIEDLRRAGLVTDSGTRRQGWGRRTRTVYALTSKGYTRAAEHAPPRHVTRIIPHRFLALTLTLGLSTFVAAGCGVVIYPSGCIQVAPDADEGQAIPGDWIYHGPSDSWWDPESGHIGWSLEEDTAIWQPTYRCAQTNGAEQ